VRIRQGFSLLDLKRFVDGLGYEGIGFGQMSLPDLLERAPVMVPVNLQGYPHFVVFRGGTSDSVLLADPAFGNITISKTKFLNGWINYKDIGHVGFIVTKDGKLVPPGRLTAGAMDFVM
jgi:predicted double-glycine peptidase